MVASATVSRKLLRLYTPVVSDVLDQMGVTDNFMTAEVKPAHPVARLAGRAFTAEAEFYGEYTQDRP